MADSTVPETDSHPDRTQPDQAQAEQRLPLRVVQKQLTRERVIEAALEVFDERGFGPTTMTDIAARANLNRGTIYLHFTDKAAIIQAALDALTPEELAIYSAADTATSRRDFEVVMDRTVDVWFTRLGRIWRHTRDAVALDPSVRQWRDEFVNRQVAKLSDVLEHHGIEPYERRYARAYLLVCMWSEFVASLGGPDAPDRAATVGALVDFFAAASAPSGETR